MPWVYLLLAGLLEVVWAAGLKWATRHPRYWPLLLVFLISVGSFLLLARAMRDLPLGTSYIVWTGIGALGAAVCGIFLYGESAHPWRLTCMLLIIVGVVGLRTVPPPATHATSPPSAGPTSSPDDK